LRRFHDSAEAERRPLDCAVAIGLDPAEGQRHVAVRAAVDQGVHRTRPVPVDGDGCAEQRHRER